MSKYVFNHQEMRKLAGKQMKAVWRTEESKPQINADERGEGTSGRDTLQRVHADEAAQHRGPTNIKRSASI